MKYLISIILASIYFLARKNTFLEKYVKETDHL